MHGASSATAIQALCMPRARPSYGTILRPTILRILVTLYLVLIRFRALD